MVSKVITINNKMGLHARPATQVVSKCREFESEIWAEFNGKTVKLKSMVNIMAAGIKQGSTITIYAKGEDEQAALDGVVELIASLRA